MKLPLMPKATATWLVENSKLTFEQIAKLCGIHSLEVMAIANDETSAGVHGLDPILNGQLTREEIARCEADPNADVMLNQTSLPILHPHRSGGRYTPVSKRQDKPDAIAWLVKHYPELTDGQIIKLLGTTKSTIAAVRNKTHRNIANIKARHPATLGLCTQAELDDFLKRGRIVTRQPMEETENNLDQEANKDDFAKSSR